MQRNPLKLALAITIIITGLMSCGSDKAAINVPKDAALVVHINAPSLSSKLSWQEIKSTTWFNELYQEADDSLARKLLDDPGNSGIDTQSDLAFFIKKHNKGGYSAFEGNIKDAAAFEAFNNKISKGQAAAKDGGVTLMQIQPKVALAYNSNRFVYVIDVPFLGMAGKQFGLSRSNEEPYSFPQDSLKKIGKDLLSLSGDDNLGNDPRFASLLKETGDVHMWMNSEHYFNALGMGAGFLSMLKLSVLFNDNVSATTLNFDNGKITMKSKSYYNEELSKLIDKYPDGKVSADMINRIPSENVVAAFAMQYPPEALFEFLKAIGVDGFVNSGMSQFGYSTEEFIKANKGDVIIAVSDLEVKSEEITIPNPDGGEPYVMKRGSAPDAKVLFATSVKDKASFDKMVGILRENIPEEAAGKISYDHNDKWFAAGNSEEQVKKFLAGGNNKLPFADRISGKAFGGYVDIQRLLKTMAPEIKDSSAMVAMDLSINTWQDAVMTAGGKKDGAIAGDFEINFVDKNTNSLKQLNSYIDKMAKIITEDKNRRRGF